MKFRKQISVCRISVPLSATNTMPVGLRRELQRGLKRLMMLREVIYRSSRRNRRGVQPHRINYPSTIMLKCRWLEDALEQGLGSLILDSLDDSIPWDQKLKRAGYTTMTSGVLYTLMRSLPGLGALLQQAYLTYILKKTLSNNVVSSQVKITQVGHIGVQSSVCIGAALAGQMLIPIPILGAVVGSAIGGVMAGVY